MTNPPIPGNPEMVKRLCPGCGCALIQRPFEHNKHFAKRKTCASPRCVDFCRSVSLAGRLAMRRRPSPVETPVNNDPFVGVVFTDDPRAPVSQPMFRGSPG